MPTSSSQKPLEQTFIAPSPKLGHRFNSSLRYWARTTFSRESLLSSIKTLAWVAPLTLLIWIYAEREQWVPGGKIGINLETHSVEAGRIVRVVSPASGSVTVELKGHQADVEQVKDWLESMPITLEVSRNLAPGQPHQVPLEAELNKLPKVVSRGVTISNCIPPEVTVLIDPIGQWEVDVAARPEDLNRLNSPPVFSPSKVRVTAPESVYEKARAQAESMGQKLVVYANLFAHKEQLATPGKHTISSVTLSPSERMDDPSVSLSPIAVSAELDVKKSDVTRTLHGVRILAAYPYGSLGDQYKAVYDPTIPTLTVSGPEQQVALLEQNPPAAIFEVDTTHPNNPAPAPLIYQLPPGVHVTPEDADRKISYTLQPRGAE